jgi:hypothetical protein
MDTPDLDMALLGKVCAPRTELVNYLSDKYEERQLSWHLISEKRIAELFHNELTGSYSILITWADGHSCLAEAGNVGAGI